MRIVTTSLILCLKILQVISFYEYTWWHNLGIITAPRECSITNCMTLQNSHKEVLTIYKALYASIWKRYSVRIILYVYSVFHWLCKLIPNPILQKTQEKKLFEMNHFKREERNKLRLNVKRIVGCRDRYGWIRIK